MEGITIPISLAAQILRMAPFKLARLIRLEINQQLPTEPWAMSSLVIFCINVGFSKISWTRFTALGTTASEFRRVIVSKLYFLSRRLLRQYPFCCLKSQSYLFYQWTVHSMHIRTRKRVVNTIYLKDRKEKRKKKMLNQGYTKKESLTRSQSGSLYRLFALLHSSTILLTFC